MENLTGKSFFFLSFTKEDAIFDFSFLLFVSEEVIKKFGSSHQQRKKDEQRDEGCAFGKR